MPRGDRQGSIIIIPAFKDARGRVVEPEKIYVRRRYRDPRTGRLREKKRLAENRTDAKEKLHDLVDEIRREKIEIIRPSRKTFAELAQHYEDEYLQPPRPGQDGLRSWYKLKTPLKVLKKEFGHELLPAIDYERIDGFRKRYLNTKTLSKKDRNIASVNRALELLRRMLRIARHRKWLSADPFTDGDPLVRKGKETKRMRILARAEENRLITACTGPRRHLRPAIIFAIDTAMRAGEQFSTRLSDVDLAQGFIRVSSLRSKTGQERIVPISERLRLELKRLPAMQRRRSTAKRDPLIFDFKRPKRSFGSACKAAKIDNFRWHDLRHTGTMRMLEAGVDPATVMKVTGHTSWTTFMRYVNLNPELVRGVAKKINQARNISRNSIPRKRRKA